MKIGIIPTLRCPWCKKRSGVKRLKHRGLHKLFQCDHCGFCFSDYRGSESIVQ